jgi:hypothetical protein
VVHALKQTSCGDVRVLILGTLGEVSPILGRHRQLVRHCQRAGVAADGRRNLRIERHRALLQQWPDIDVHLTLGASVVHQRLVVDELRAGNCELDCDGRSDPLLVVVVDDLASLDRGRCDWCDDGAADCHPEALFCQKSPTVGDLIFIVAL